MGGKARTRGLSAPHDRFFIVMVKKEPALSEAKDPICARCAGCFPKITANYSRNFTRLSRYGRIGRIRVGEDGVASQMPVQFSILVQVKRLVFPFCAQLGAVRSVIVGFYVPEIRPSRRVFPVSAEIRSGNRVTRPPVEGYRWYIPAEDSYSCPK